jgi:hypothetical protein
MTDLALRPALIIKVLKKLGTGQFDIVASFHSSELVGEIYIRLLDMSNTC